MASSSQVRRWWVGYRCAPGRFAQVSLLGHAVSAAAPATDAFVALDRTLRSTGYRAATVFGYACRRVRFSTVWSLHAYALAVDIDPDRNPFYRFGRRFSWGDTAFTPAQIAAVEAVRTTGGARLWTWGGRWTAPRDYMHFQLNAAPGFAVEWSTVPSEGEEWMFNEEPCRVLGAEVIRALFTAHPDVFGGDPAYWADCRAPQSEWPDFWRAYLKAVAKGASSGNGGPHRHDDRYARLDHGHRGTVEVR